MPSSRSARLPIMTGGGYPTRRTRRSPAIVGTTRRINLKRHYAAALQGQDPRRRRWPLFRKRTTQASSLHKQKTFMGFLVPLTLFGWIPFVLTLFALFPPRRAQIMAFLAAWLFLPMAGYKVPGLPDYTKMSATALGVLMGAAIFDTDRLLGFRLKWIDLPMILWC